MQTIIPNGGHVKDYELSDSHTVCNYIEIIIHVLVCKTLTGLKSFN